MNLNSSIFILSRVRVYYYTNSTQFDYTSHMIYNQLNFGKWNFINKKKKKKVEGK